MSDTREILKKIQHIELKTRRLVSTTFAGQYHSVFKGRGMNFEEVRQYQPGDEIRSIDWNVTARSGEAYVKKFTEERDLTVMLVIDVSASGNYGSVHSSKRELAAEVAALLAFSAIRNNDKVGLLLFTGEVELFIPPRKGRIHGLRVIREVLYHEPKHRGTNLSIALRYLNRVVPRRCVTFLLSDFLSDDYERDLLTTAKRHDLVAVPILDPGEMEIPGIGLLLLEDLETGEQIEVNTATRQFRDRFAGEAEASFEDLERMFTRNGIDSISLRTDADYLPPLRAFFLKREQRKVHA